MADPHEEGSTRVVDEAREPWPEETDDLGPKTRAKSYFRQHPAAKWVILFLFIAVVVAGVQVWRYYSVRETTDDAQVDAHIAQVSARVSGTVIKINVDDNQSVKAGAVLVQLDTRDYQVALQRAEADLADAQAGERAARTTVPITSTNTRSVVEISQANEAAAQKQVAAARARLREAEANHTKAAQDLERMRQLVAKDEVSRQQYDTAVAAEQAARAGVDAAAAAVATTQSQVVQAQAQVRQAGTGAQQVAVTEARAGSAGASVAKQEAAVAQARLNLQYTTIVAPFDGIVSKRSVEPGQVVQAGQPLLSLVDLSHVWATVNFKETQLEHMQVGRQATIHVDAFDRDYKGHVDSLGGGTGARFSLLPPENATGNYVKVVQRVPVKIVFDPGQDTSALRPGMSVNVTVKTK